MVVPPAVSYFLLLSNMRVEDSHQGITANDLMRYDNIEQAQNNSLEQFK